MEQSRQPSRRWWFNLNLMICQFYIPACNKRLFQVHREKRQVPGILQKILAADVFLTQRFCNWADCFLPFRSLRLHYKVLEVSVTSYIFEMVAVSLCLICSHDILTLWTSVVIQGRYKYVKWWHFYVFVTIVDQLFFFRVSAQFSRWVFLMFPRNVLPPCSGSCGCWSG